MNQLPQNAINIDPSLITIEWKEDLIFFDGPLLSIGTFQETNRIPQQVMFLWIDFSSDVNRWLVFPIKDSQKTRYLQREISLLQLIKDNNHVWCIDINGDLQLTSVHYVEVSNLSSDYLPTDHSFYDTTWSGL